MKSKTIHNILPEEKVRLTQEQKNLIELAFIKQLPPKDVKFIEKVKKQTKSLESKLDSFAQLSGYYAAKYGSEFGMIYLSAIMGGEEKYKETVVSVEQMRVKARIKKQSS